MNTHRYRQGLLLAALWAGLQGAAQASGFGDEYRSLAIGPSLGFMATAGDGKQDVRLTSSFALLPFNGGVDVTTGDNKDKTTSFMGLGFGHLLAVQRGRSSEEKLWRLRSELPLGAIVKNRKRDSGVYGRLLLTLDILEDAPASHGDYRVGVGLVQGL